MLLKQFETLIKTIFNIVSIFDRDEVNVLQADFEFDRPYSTKDGMTTSSNRLYRQNYGS
jgi:hypothetical protein